MVLVGAVAGIALGMASVRYIETLLYEVKGTDMGMLIVAFPDHPGSGIVGGAAGGDPGRANRSGRDAARRLDGSPDARGSTAPSR